MASVVVVLLELDIPVGQQTLGVVPTNPHCDLLNKSALLELMGRFFKMLYNCSQSSSEMHSPGCDNGVLQ